MVAPEMNMHQRLVTLSLVAAGLLGAGTTTTPSPAPSGDAVAGKETFTQYCSICHAVGAKGFIGPSIAGVNWTVPGLHTIVRGGLGGYGGMPAFDANAVTDKNIADIAAYLVSLGPKAPVGAASTAAVSTTAPAASTSSAPQAAASGAGDPLHGRQIFTANCVACHGANAQGGIGPNLHGERTRKNTAAAIAFIKDPISPMPKLYPAVLTEKDVEDVAAYVESL
jgi:mono/diheme cytochrome c family protein